MTMHEIGTNAGTIWNLLSDNNNWSYSQLQEESGLSDSKLNAAIGWLARENKIEINEDRDTGTDTFHNPHYNQYF
ncbi:MAG: winged helix-turn-helix domain-containing protein [Bacteroidales bacterium]|nr:winged helix-turn-helix domain-containing protein [Bacteroidales bacterium]MCM1147202.1 winged helix-turn-helix domain-containing protein [Bacteroidales bacterium]MCM1205428.1 winged helix-turn-helix domain-containing protein [Bacillota bacterium]MCM1509767.1 winged helix-turn-helix domain-containing protein [Clostridium sp.]